MFMGDYTPSARENAAAFISMIILTAICIVLRICVRVIQRKGLVSSDWFCILAVVLLDAYCACNLYFIFNVTMYKAYDFAYVADPVEIRNLFKFLYPTEILFALVITAAKLSILCFNHELFQSHRTFSCVIKATAAVCVVWLIVVTFLTIFQCSPMGAVWEEHFDPDKCFVTPKLLLGSEIPNLFLDVAILCIPLLVIRQLQLTTIKKLTVAGVFLLGIFVCVASIIRITAIWKPPRIATDMDFHRTMLWSTLQLGLAIICACLPTYGPLVPALSRPVSYAKKWYDSRGGTSHTGNRGQGSAAAPNGSSTWVRVGDDAKRGYRSRSMAGNGGFADNESEHALRPMMPVSGQGGVKMAREVEVV